MDDVADIDRVQTPDIGNPFLHRPPASMPTAPRGTSRTEPSPRTTGLRESQVRHVPDLVPAYVGDDARAELDPEAADAHYRTKSFEDTAAWLLPTISGGADRGGASGSQAMSHTADMYGLSLEAIGQIMSFASAGEP